MKASKASRVIIAVVVLLVVLVLPATADAKARHQPHALLTVPSCTVTLGEYNGSPYLFANTVGLTPDTLYGTLWKWPNPDGWMAGGVQTSDANGSIVGDWFYAYPGATEYDVVTEHDTETVVASCLGPVL